MVDSDSTSLKAFSTTVLLDDPVSTSDSEKDTVVVSSSFEFSEAEAAEEAVDVLEELAADELVELVLLVDFKLLNNDDAVLSADDTFTLTETEALDEELEDDEVSSEVAVEE